MTSENTTEETTQSKLAENLDFTDANVLMRYVTDTGKILPRRITGLTSFQQRSITRAIKRARNMLLMK